MKKITLLTILILSYFCIFAQVDVIHNTDSTKTYVAKRYIGRSGYKTQASIIESGENKMICLNFGSFNLCSIKKNDTIYFRQANGNVLKLNSCCDFKCHLEYVDGSDIILYSNNPRYILTPEFLNKFYNSNIIEIYMECSLSKNGHTIKFNTNGQDAAILRELFNQIK